MTARVLDNNELALLGYRIERLAIEGEFAVLRGGNLAVLHDGSIARFRTEPEAVTAMHSLARADGVIG